MLAKCCDTFFCGERVTRNWSQTQTPENACKAVFRPTVTQSLLDEAGAAFEDNQVNPPGGFIKLTADHGQAGVQRRACAKSRVWPPDRERKYSAGWPSPDWFPTLSAILWRHNAQMELSVGGWGLTSPPPSSQTKGYSQRIFLKFSRLYRPTLLLLACISVPAMLSVFDWLTVKCLSVSRWKARWWYICFRLGVSFTSSWMGKCCRYHSIICTIRKRGG